MDEWTLAGWLTSIPGVSSAIAGSLLSVGRVAGQSELSFVRSLGAAGSRERLLELLQQSDVLEVLSNSIFQAAEELTAAPAATAAELHAKFLQDGAGTLTYSDLSTFFRGLEGRIGAPDPKVIAAMEAEHTARGDSANPFTTGNYAVTTTSLIEWAFVATPEAMPDDGWPVEEALAAAALGPSPGREASNANAALLASSASMREPLPLAELQARLEERSERLRAMDEPPLSLPEAMSARLYTGPMFVKYNCVLRGLDSAVAPLRAQMVGLCSARADAEALASGGATYAQVRTVLNTYTTTLHAINSSIVKLSKLTVACKVYRGVSGRMLPEQFWRANAFNVKGGIDSAFMSTTCDKEVAMSYAAGAPSGAGFIFEIQQGMVDRGADISFLSQYPHEEEILVSRTLTLTPTLTLP